jgi:hypothetical protein
LGSYGGGMRPNNGASTALLSDPVEIGACWCRGKGNALPGGTRHLETPLCRRCACANPAPFCLAKIYNSARQRGRSKHPSPMT